MSTLSNVSGLALVLLAGTAESNSSVEFNDWPGHVKSVLQKIVADHHRDDLKELCKVGCDLDAGKLGFEKYGFDMQRIKPKLFFHNLKNDSLESADLVEEVVTEVHLHHDVDLVPQKLRKDEDREDAFLKLGFGGQVGSINTLNVKTGLTGPELRHIIDVPIDNIVRFAMDFLFDVMQVKSITLADEASITCRDINGDLKSHNGRFVNLAMKKKYFSFYQRYGFQAAEALDQAEAKADKPEDWFKYRDSTHEIWDNGTEVAWKFLDDLFKAKIPFPKSIQDNALLSEHRDGLDEIKKKCLEQNESVDLKGCIQLLQKGVSHEFQRNPDPFGNSEYCTYEMDLLAHVHALWQMSMIRLQDIAIDPKPIKKIDKEVLSLSDNKTMMTLNKKDYDKRKNPELNTKPKTTKEKFNEIKFLDDSEKKEFLSWCGDMSPQELRAVYKRHENGEGILKEFQNFASVQKAQQAQEIEEAEEKTLKNMQRMFASAEEEVQEQENLQNMQLMLEKADGEYAKADKARLVGQQPATRQQDNNESQESDYDELRRKEGERIVNREIESQKKRVKEQRRQQRKVVQKNTKQNMRNQGEKTRFAKKWFRNQ